EIPGVAAAPRTGRARAGARGIFPLRLRREAIRMAGLRRQPGRISLRIAPTDTDNGIAPRLIDWLTSNCRRSPVAFGIAGEAGCLGKSRELSAGHVVDSHRERTPDGDGMQWRLGWLVTGVSARRTHREVARRHDAQGRAISAISEGAACRRTCCARDE